MPPRVQMMKLVAAVQRKDYHFVHLYGCCYELIFFADVIWASFGYLLSFKLLDTHVRSAEPTFLGEGDTAHLCQPQLGIGVLWHRRHPI